MLSRDRTLCARCARTVSPRPSATLMSASISPAVEDLQINRVNSVMDQGMQESINGMHPLGITLTGERGSDLAQTDLRFIDLYLVA